MKNMKLDIKRTFSHLLPPTLAIWFRVKLLLVKRVASEVFPTAMSPTTTIFPLKTKDGIESVVSTKIVKSKNNHGNSRKSTDSRVWGNGKRVERPHASLEDVALLAHRSIEIVKCSDRRMAIGLQCNCQLPKRALMGDKQDVCSL